MGVSIPVFSSVGFTPVSAVVFRISVMFSCYFCTCKWCCHWWWRITDIVCFFIFWYKHSLEMYCNCISLFFADPTTFPSSSSTHRAAVFFISSHFTQCLIVLICIIFNSFKMFPFFFYFTFIYFSHFVSDFIFHLLPHSF